MKQEMKLLVEVAPEGFWSVELVGNEGNVRVLLKVENNQPRMEQLARDLKSVLGRYGVDVELEMP